MSRRQDYIARVRYQNPLPPPPAAPKLIETHIDFDRLLTAGALSSVVLERDVNPELDMDLGMPIDLTVVPHAFETDTDAFGPGPEVELDPEDKELLIEPSAAGTNQRSSSPGVSFLRRTEYISVDGQRGKVVLQAQLAEKLSPEQELQRIETTFEQAQSPLDQLKHPKRKNLKAVKSWQLLPDSKQFDLQHLIVRMIGSASLSNLKNPPSKQKLEASVFNNFKAGIDDDEEEWMGFYVPESDEQAEEIKAKLADTQDTLNPEQIEEQSSKTWELAKLRDYDIEFTLNEQDYEEILINTNDETQTAHYIAVSGRTNLKRRRVEARKADKLKEYDFDDLEVGLREVTAEESIERDGARSAFDPVTYSSEQS